MARISIDQLRRKHKSTEDRELPKALKIRKRLEDALKKAKIEIGDDYQRGICFYAMDPSAYITNRHLAPADKLKRRLRHHSYWLIGFVFKRGRLEQVNAARFMQISRESAYEAFEHDVGYLRPCNPDLPPYLVTPP